MLQEGHFVVVALLKLTKVFLKIIDVLQNFFQDIVETFCTLMLQSCTFGTQQLRVFFVVVQSFDAVFKVVLDQKLGFECYLHRSVEFFV